MLSPPERPPPQKIAFSYGASTSFSKSGRFIPGNEGYQIEPFVVGPPLRPATPRRLPPGGVPKCLKICSKKHFLSQSRCVAGPELCSKLIQNEASSLLGPPFRPEIRRRLPLGFSWAALGLLLAAPGLLLAAPGLLLAPPGLLLTHTSIRTSHLEGSRAGRCILRRRDSRCVVS